MRYKDTRRRFSCCGVLTRNNSAVPASRLQARQHDLRMALTQFLRELPLVSAEGERADGAAVRIALGAAASMSFFPDRKDSRGLIKQCSVLLYLEFNHHDSFFPPAPDLGTRHSARDIIETCRCRSLYIRFCYFVPKSTSHHLYTF
jgi:hypothetical protein